jgi:CxxC-x17-CxxC domain-containing protein
MAFGGRRQFGGPREMHKAVCADCGQECEVPFKPAEGRPVYCRDCYAKKKGPSTNRFERGPRQEQQPQKEAPAESEDFEESTSEETEEFSEE